MTNKTQFSFYSNNTTTTSQYDNSLLKYTNYLPNNYSTTTNPITYASYYAPIDTNSAMTVQLAKNSQFELPNGDKLIIDDLGNFKVESKNDGKIIYRHNTIREFNEYVNASDLLEEFIKFLGEKGVKQSNILHIPIEIFINWLIFKAAEKDQIDVEESQKVLDCKTHELKTQPRCRFCGRFIPNKFVELGINFCNQIHMSRYMEVHILC